MIPIPGDCRTCARRDACEDEKDSLCIGYVQPEPAKDSCRLPQPETAEQRRERLIDVTARASFDLREDDDADSDDSWEVVAATLEEAESAAAAERARRELAQAAEGKEEQ